MGKIVHCHRVNLVNINYENNMIEPSDTFMHFHMDCYDRWFKRQARQGAFSYSDAELEVDSDNLVGIDCHSCQKPMSKEIIRL